MDGLIYTHTSKKPLVYTWYINILIIVILHYPLTAGSHCLHYHLNNLNTEKSQPSGDLNLRLLL